MYEGHLNVIVCLLHWLLHWFQHCYHSASTVVKCFKPMKFLLFSLFSKVKFGDFKEPHTYTKFTSIASSPCIFFYLFFRLLDSCVSKFFTKLNSKTANNVIKNPTLAIVTLQVTLCLNLLLTCFPNMSTKYAFVCCFCFFNWFATCRWSLDVSSNSRLTCL